ALATGREVGDLPGYERIQFRALEPAQVTVFDHVVVQPGRAEHRAVPLDGPAGAHGRGHTAHLGVVRAQQLVAHTHSRQTPLGVVVQSSHRSINGLRSTPV